MLEPSVERLSVKLALIRLYCTKGDESTPSEVKRLIQEAIDELTPLVGDWTPHWTPPKV